MGYRKQTHTSLSHNQSLKGLSLALSHLIKDEWSVFTKEIPNLENDNVTPRSTRRLDLPHAAMEKAQYLQVTHLAVNGSCLKRWNELNPLRNSILVSQREFQLYIPKYPLNHEITLQDRLDSPEKGK